MPGLLKGGGSRRTPIRRFEIGMTAKSAACGESYDSRWITPCCAGGSSVHNNSRPVVPGAGLRRATFHQSAEFGQARRVKPRPPQRVVPAGAI